MSSKKKAKPAGHVSLYQDLIDAYASLTKALRDSESPEALAKYRAAMDAVLARHQAETALIMEQLATPTPGDTTFEQSQPADHS